MQKGQSLSRQMLDTKFLILSMTLGHTEYIHIINVYNILLCMYIKYLYVYIARVYT